MKLENQVCSFDQAALFYSRGVRHETAFWWFQDKKTGKNIVLPVTQYMLPDNWEKMYPAYNVAELGVLLGKYNVMRYSFDENWRLYNDKEILVIWLGIFEHEAHARADAFIHLLDNGVLKAGDLKL